MVVKILEKWKNFVEKRRSSGRPLNEMKYGSGMDQITIRLPKSVYAQLELVNLKDSMDAFPYDFDLKMKFINKILPYTFYLDKPVNSIDMLGFENIETLIVMYSDLLLSPLSLRAQETMTQTIESLLQKEQQ